MACPVNESVAPITSVEIPQSVGVAPGQQSPVHLERGYPSWPPKRPSPPAPGSTLHSLSTVMMFGDGRGVTPSTQGEEEEGQPAPATIVNSRRPCHSGGRKPTPRSVRIVSMQDSNAATSAAGGVGSGGRHREHQGTDRTTTTRVSSNAGATHPHPHTLPPPRPSFSFPFFPSSSFFRARVWSRATKASAIGALSPTLFSSSQAPDVRLRAALATPPKFRSPGLHLELLRDPSWKTRIHFYLFPILVLAHVPLQTFLDFNAIYILIE